MAAQHPSDGRTFGERLAVPSSWWVVAGLAVLAVTVTLSVAPLVLLVVAPPLTAVALALALRSYALEVVVDEMGLRAGRAALPWTAIGTVEVLDADAARRLRGPEADPRAYLALRSYVPRAVRVGVADPADPTPYWYVSTRRPEALAAALGAGPGERS